MQSVIVLFTLQSKQTSKQTNKQTSKQTNRQANKQTDKQTNKQTSKQTYEQANKHAFTLYPNMGPRAKILDTQVGYSGMHVVMQYRLKLRNVFQQSTSACLLVINLLLIYYCVINVTSTMSHQQCHINNVTSTKSHQQCHINKVTSTMSHQQSHINNVTSTMSYQQCHINNVTSTISCLSPKVKVTKYARIDCWH